MATNSIYIWYNYERSHDSSSLENILNELFACNEISDAFEMYVKLEIYHENVLSCRHTSECGDALT